MPGYGYARTSKNQRSGFAKIITDYVFKCERLHFLFVLVDSRIEPQRIDLAFIEQLGIHGIPFGIIFTKCEKLSSAQRRRTIENYSKRLSEQWEELPTMLASSSANGMGKEEILAFVEDCLHSDQ